MVLPVERTHGVFQVHGQTGEARPTLFERQYDARRTFLGMDLKVGHDQPDPATDGSMAVAVNKCLQVVDAPSLAEKVSALRPGPREVTIKDRATNRRASCVVAADGGPIEEWIELD
jgi:hypothetical protein